MNQTAEAKEDPLLVHKEEDVLQGDGPPPMTQEDILEFMQLLPAAELCAKTESDSFSFQEEGMQSSQTTEPCVGNSPM